MPRFLWFEYLIQPKFQQVNEGFRSKGPSGVSGFTDCAIGFLIFNKNMGSVPGFPLVSLMVGLANAFDISVDYLVRSDKNMAVGKLHNQELLRRIEQLDNKPEADQDALVRVLDAFIKKQRFEKVIQEEI